MQAPYAPPVATPSQNVPSVSPVSSTPSQSSTQKFKFKIFTSSDPDAQYAALTTKDALTFYLLNNGKGYLGGTKLFDATDSGVTVAASIASDATGSTTEAASTKAVVDYVAAKVSGLGVLTDKFFRAVKSHTITAEDLTNTAISVPEGTQAGEVGLLFTSDNDNADGNEQYYFISLKNYLQTVYSFTDTNSIAFTIGDNNSVSANIKIADGETGLAIGSTGLHLEKVDTINESAPTNKLVTEDKMVSYVQNSVLPAVDTAVTEALKNVVTSEIDDGTGGTDAGGTGGTGTSGGESQSPQTYSTEETCIGTWTDGKPLYRRVVIGKTPSTAKTEEVIGTIDSNLAIKNIRGAVDVDYSANNYFVPVPHYCYLDTSPAAEEIVSIYYNVTTGQITSVVSSIFCNRNVEIIIEYTKPSVVPQSAPVQSVEDVNIQAPIPQAP